MAIQKFRSLTNWIFHAVYDFVCGAVRQTAALGFLGLKVPKKVKMCVVMWTSDEQKMSISRSMAAESKQLLGVVRSGILIFAISVSMRIVT